MTSEETISGNPIVFGEILFDCFPDGREMLGGAPFNVAWHLRGFGLDPLMISRIGKDEKGEEIRQKMALWGMQTCGVEMDELYPTGRVIAVVDAGEPEYQIQPHQAYDRIDGGLARSSGMLEQAQILYHGTLAVRAVPSRNALRRIIDDCSLRNFVDVNLRSPWWTPERTGWCLANACWAKLNNEELSTLTSIDCRSEGHCVEAARVLATSHSIETLIVTRGEQGAILTDAGDFLARTDAVSVAHRVDTVGAGDGFSAVAILGLLYGWKPMQILERASRFAAEICSIQGATTTDLDLYRKHLEEWRPPNE